MKTQSNQDEQWKLLVFQLDEIRIKNKISKKQISEQTGIAAPHVARFFLCKFPPNLATFFKIANALNTKIEIK